MLVCAICLTVDAPIKHAIELPQHHFGASNHRLNLVNTDHFFPSCLCGLLVCQVLSTVCLEDTQVNDNILLILCAILHPFVHVRSLSSPHKWCAIFNGRHWGEPEERINCFVTLCLTTFGRYLYKTVFVWGSTKGHKTQCDKAIGLSFDGPFVHWK